MRLPKYSVLPLLLLIVAFASGKSSAVEATRPLSLFPKQGYAKAFATLGIACECCDGAGGECSSTWTESCSKLKCLPWKQH